MKQRIKWVLGSLLCLDMAVMFTRPPDHPLPVILGIIPLALMAVLIDLSGLGRPRQNETAEVFRRDRRG